MHVEFAHTVPSASLEFRICKGSQANSHGNLIYTPLPLNPGQCQEGKGLASTWQGRSQYCTKKTVPSERPWPEIESHQVLAKALWPREEGGRFLLGGGGRGVRFP